MGKLWNFTADVIHTGVEPKSLVPLKVKHCGDFVFFLANVSTPQMPFKKRLFDFFYIDAQISLFPRCHALLKWLHFTGFSAACCFMAVFNASQQGDEIKLKGKKRSWRQIGGWEPLCKMMRMDYYGCVWECGVRERKCVRVCVWCVPILWRWPKSMAHNGSHTMMPSQHIE